MIYYFSGTGNCLFVAQKLSETLGDNYFPLEKYEGGSEIVGVVYPVYYGGLPLPVKEFFEKADFHDVKYLYSVATYGGNIAAADAQIAKILKKRNLSLDASFGVIAPDNFIPLFNPPDKKTAEKILEKTENALPEICDKISKREKTGILTKFSGKVYKLFAYPAYLNGRKTDKFFVDDNCVKCGLCEKICPSKTIKLTETGVEWTKPRCYFCLGCINRCPQKAIRYGKNSANKNRYVNPVLIK